MPATCFVLAADAADVPAAAAAVQRAGARPILPEDLALTPSPLVEVLREAITGVDVVVAVFSALVPNDTTLFTLGMAAAFAKPTVVVTPPDLRVPDLPAVTMFVRDSGPEYDGLRMSLKRVLDAMSEGLALPARLPSVSGMPRLHPIGELSQTLLHDLHALKRHPRESVLIDTLFSALTAGGAAPVRGGGPDARFDLGVWAPELEALVGNPLVIEVKVALPSIDSVSRAIAQVDRYLTETGGRWALLVYLSGTDATVREVAWTSSVLTANLEHLILALANVSFAEYVRRLRAERVHNSPPP